MSLSRLPLAVGMPEVARAVPGLPYHLLMVSKLLVTGVRPLIVGLVTTSLVVSGTVLAVAGPDAAASPAEGATPASKTASKAATVHWDTCRPEVPERGKCGHIRVLADPLRPGLGKQRVGFELYRRTDRSTPAVGTIVAHEGGPGYPATGSRGSYLPLFKPVAHHRDILLVDQRGTGTSGALDCKALQNGETPYVKAVGACGEQLGARADTYSTAYATDDTVAVMDALGVDQIDLYGDSYGTFFAQSFAVRHPDRVRTLMVDASYPISGQDVWWRDTNRAIKNALTYVCERDDYCSGLKGSAVNRMRTLAQQVHDDPLEGHAFNASGRRKDVTLDGVSLALVTAYATYGPSIYRELDSAVRAYRQGYERPLLRLVAENVSDGYAAGNPMNYSAGQYTAVICSDYPQLWDVTLPLGAERRQQYRDAVADVEATDPNGFDPFRADDWIKSGWTEPKTCLDWPAPSDPLPPEPVGADYPEVPTLVLSGDLDTITSPEGGLDVASRFPNSTFVSVPNVGHVTAMGDRPGCVAGIVQRFVRTGGSVGDTSCVDEKYAPIRAVPTFARTSEGLAPAGQGPESLSRSDRRVVQAALFGAADPITRWYINYSGHGVGLAGGTFTYGGTSSRVVFTLDDIGFVNDVAVTGRVVWDRNSGMTRATVDVDGPGRHDGELRAVWNDQEFDAQATVSGELAGQDVELTTPAP